MTVLLLQYLRYLFAVEVDRVERIAPLGDLSPLDARLIFPAANCLTLVLLKNGRLLPATRVLDMRECPAVQTAAPFLAAALKSNPFAGFFVSDDKLYGLLGRDFLEPKE
jgi:hypothetical protein